MLYDDPISTVAVIPARGIQHRLGGTTGRRLRRSMRRCLRSSATWRSPCPLMYSGQQPHPTSFFRPTGLSCVRTELSESPPDSWLRFRRFVRPSVSNRICLRRWDIVCLPSTSVHGHNPHGQRQSASIIGISASHLGKQNIVRERHD